MNLDQLKYVAEVAKTGSLSAASKELFITQSAISQSISHLEKELGAKIFIRSRNGAVPTEFGKSMIQKSLEILEKMEIIKREAMSDDLMRTGTLRLGTIPSPLMYLPKTLASFKKEYPNMKLHIVEQSSQEIIDAILEDELDIGLIGLSMEGDEFRQVDLHIETVLRGKMIVAASKHSPLAFANTISLEELKRATLVIYDDDRMWEFINQVAAGEVLFSTNNQDAIRNAVTENLAITVAPDYTIHNDPFVLSGEIVPIEIENLNQEYPGMALVSSKARSDVMIEKFSSQLIEDMVQLKK